MINVSKFWSKKQYNQTIRSLFPNIKNLCKRFHELKTETRVKMKLKKNKKRMNSVISSVNISSKYGRKNVWTGFYLKPRL